MNVKRVYGFFPFEIDYFWGKLLFHFPFPFDFPFFYASHSSLFQTKYGLQLDNF